MACSSDLLIFKNNKPFYKFCVPPGPLTPLEEECWKLFAEPNYDTQKLIADLKSVNFNQLSGRSQELLNLQPNQAQEYIQRYVGITPIKTSPIVCMSTLNRSSQDALAVACPVLGTEDGIIYVLDPQIFTVLHQVRSSLSNRPLSNNYLS